MDAKPRRTRRVLLTGDFLHSDFAAVREFLASCEDLQVEEANLLDAPAGSGDLIALCQSRPGQFAQGDVERLHARAPLAHLLAILGSWCEGEARSGRPWHGVERVYWYEASGRLRWLLGTASPRSNCRTHSPAERIEHRVARWPRAKDGTTAVILAQRRCDYEPLADLCRVLHMEPRWQRDDAIHGPEPQLLLLSADDARGGEQMAALARFRAAWPGARRIALLNFPRQDEVAALWQAGFHQVLGKPLLITDLLSGLDGAGVSNDQERMAASSGRGGRV